MTEAKTFGVCIERDVSTNVQQALILRHLMDRLERLNSHIDDLILLERARVDALASSSDNSIVSCAEEERASKQWLFVQRQFVAIKEEMEQVGAPESVRLRMRTSHFAHERLMELVRLQKHSDYTSVVCRAEVATVSGAGDTKAADRAGETKVADTFVDVELQDLASQRRVTAGGLADGDGSSSAGAAGTATTVSSESKQQQQQVLTSGLKRKRSLEHSSGEDDEFCSTSSPSSVKRAKTLQTAVATPVHVSISNTTNIAIPCFLVRVEATFKDRRVPQVILSDISSVARTLSFVIPSLDAYNEINSFACVYESSVAFSDLAQGRRYADVRETFDFLPPTPVYV